MTNEEFLSIKHHEIFIHGYAGRKFFTQSVKDNTKIEIMRLIDSIAEYVKDKATIVIHCLYESSGHVTNSRHYRGEACDFHLKPIEKMLYVDQIELINEALERLNQSEKVGLGIYPTWNNKGFHLDVRGFKSRWGFIGKYEVSYTDALKYTVDKKL